MVEWFVVMSKPNQEFQTEEKLLKARDKATRKKLFTVYQPKFEETYWDRGRKRTRPVPLLGSYIFVQWTPPWNLVLEIDSVSSVLRVNEALRIEGISPVLGTERPHGPLLVGDEILQEIRGLERKGFVVGLQPGQTVRVREGLFAGALARFSNFSKQGREVVFLDLLNRTVRTELPAKTLVPA
jgi:transcription antitermination factor NusG